MSWLSTPEPKKPQEKKEQPSVIQKFFTACLLILGGIILLHLALQLLSEIWIWLVIGAVVAAAIWVAIRLWANRENRW